MSARDRASGSAQAPAWALDRTLGLPRRVWWLLGAALAMRVGWALGVESATASTSILDATFYFRSAQHLTEGYGYVRVFGDPTAYFPPGYPFLLAAFFLVTGPVPIVASLLNAVAGAATVHATWGLGERVLGARVGFVGAAVLTLWPSHVYATSATMSDVVFTCLLTYAIWAFVVLEGSTQGARLRFWWLLGLLLGYTSLVRGVALVYVSVLALVLVVNRGVTRAAAVRMAVLLLGLFCILGPWILRNQITLGSPVLLSTDGAWAFFNAHNEFADGGQSTRIDLHRKELFDGQLSGLGRGHEYEIELEKVQMRYALHYMLTHPLEELRQIPLRIGQLHAGDAWPLRWTGHWHWKDAERRKAAEEQDRRDLLVTQISAGIDPWLPRVANAYYFAMLPLGLIGLLALCRPATKPAWILPLTVLYFHALHGLLFFGMPRFHVPFLPELAIGAAWVAISLFDRGMRRTGTTGDLAATSRVL